MYLQEECRHILQLNQELTRQRSAIERRVRQERARELEATERAFQIQHQAKVEGTRQADILIQENEYLHAEQERYRQEIQNLQQRLGGVLAQLPHAAV